MTQKRDGMSEEARVTDKDLNQATLIHGNVIGIVTFDPKSVTLEATDDLEWSPSLAGNMLFYDVEIDSAIEVLQKAKELMGGSNGSQK